MLVNESTMLPLVVGYRHMICFSVLKMDFGTEYRVRIWANSARAPGVTEVVSSISLGAYSTTCMGYPVLGVSFSVFVFLCRV